MNSGVGEENPRRQEFVNSNIKEMGKNMENNKAKNTSEAHKEQEMIYFDGMPVTEEGVVNLLSSGAVKGVGKVTARKIVKHAGELRGGLEKLIGESEEEIEGVIAGVEGIGAKKAKEIAAALNGMKGHRPTLALLYSAGLSDAEVEKITGHYKKNTRKVVLEDPYQMVEEVFKLSFFTADKLGRLLAYGADDPRRIRGALLTAVKFAAERGSMFSGEEEAVEVASRILGVDKEKVAAEIPALISDERLVRSRGGLYLPPYYKAEKEAAERITTLILQSSPCVDASGEGGCYTMPDTDRDGHPLSSGQKDAIESVIRNPVTVITGGPGTGKTTTVRGLISVFEDMDKRVVLAAPTGRAAKRLEDLSGRPAQTLHRLLGHSPGRGYRKKIPDVDILIIDESSMLEQVMFNHLLEAVGPGTKIVLVGDPDQLPAIGAGDVLKDMIRSGRVPVVRLTENFRHSEGSEIAENAAAIREGRPLTPISEEFMIVNETGSGHIHSRILDLVSRTLPARFNVDAKDIMVVTPQQEGPLGAKQLNIDLQEMVNPGAPELKRGMKRFRLGDRVMQTSNSSARNTYNGVTGRITALDPEREIIEVTFNDGKRLEYGKRDFKELTLAYATTVHKLQGSETDYMVMPVSLSHRPMLYRNLLYTGVSRARKGCVLVGEPKAIDMAVNNPAPAVRNSNFKNRLRDRLPEIKK